MGNIVGSIRDFIAKILITGMVSSGLLLLAGEVKLAALRKASRGSTKLSRFTEKTTGTKLFQDAH